MLRVLKTKLAAADSREVIHAVSDAINGRRQPARPASEQNTSRSLLNIGNLCGATASPATRNAFDDLWRRFDFDALGRAIRAACW